MSYVCRTFGRVGKHSLNSQDMVATSANTPGGSGNSNKWQPYLQQEISWESPATDIPPLILLNVTHFFSCDYKEAVGRPSLSPT